MSDSNIDYIDDYSACDRTYATLRIYPSDKPPQHITDFLGIEPTRTSIYSEDKGKVNGWFLSSQDYVTSRDSRRHIDWILDQIEPLKIKFLELHKSKIMIDICCFWESSTGNGGPTISPKQMKRLVKFDLELWWDVWFSE